MKKVIIQHKKYPIILLGLVMLSSLASAQASYIGGIGGGYASLSISSSTSVFSIDQTPVKTFDFSVFPNPLRSNQTLKLKIQGVDSETKLEVIVSDMIGSKIHTEEIISAAEVSVNLPIERMKKGIYLITLKYNKNKVTHRFSYSQ